MSFIHNILFEEKNTPKWKFIFWLNSLLLLYLTLMPSIQIKVSFANIDKVFHIIGFGSFAFFCFLAFPKLKNLSVTGIAVALGILVEIIQSFLPSRSFSYLDMFADVFGIVLAVLFLSLLKNKYSIT